MTSKGKKLLDQALRLSPAEREALAGQLFDSLEAEDLDAEAAWQAEIERRCRVRSWKSQADPMDRGEANDLRGPG